MKWQPAIEVACLCKSYGNVEVLRSFSLEVRPGEVICLFGPNGCGKSTLLHVLAGLEQLDGGEVLIAGKPPCEAKTGFVFQDYNASLFPWRNSLDNVAYSLECVGVKRRAARLKARALLEKVGLVGCDSKYPYELSGGMRQRMAIARSLAFEPDALLLDEPFSALDFETRLRIEEELLRILSRQKITTLCVSHDVDEAVFLADKVIVLGPRPASVKGIIEVCLPRPRTMATRASKRFFGVRRRVIALYRKQLRAEKQ